MTTPSRLAELLVDVVDHAELDAPPVDPVSALQGRRERARTRRGYLALVAFVLLAFVVQADAHPAHGETAPAALAAQISPAHV